MYSKELSDRFTEACVAILEEDPAHESSLDRLYRKRKQVYRITSAHYAITVELLKEYVETCDEYKDICLLYRKLLRSSERMLFIAAFGLVSLTILFIFF